MSNGPGDASVEKSDQRFRSLVETTSDWVWEVDEDLVYTYASPRVGDILGYAPDEVLGRRPFDFMRGEEAERVRKTIFEAFMTRRPFASVENTNLHKLGHEVVLETSAVPFFDAAGQFRGYRGIDRDVTAHRRAEDALAASELRFRELLATVNLAAVMLDPRGSITFCNDYLLHLTGWREEEVVGADWFDVFIPAQGREEMRAVFGEAISTGSLLSHRESPIVTRQGGLRLVEWDNTLLRDSAGRIVGTASLGHDLTERKLLEDQYRQAQKLESIGRLAGGVAHDFNNLLTVINGYSDLLLGLFSSDDPRRAAVEQISKAGERAACLTKELLAFSRKQVIQPKPLNLNRLLAEIDQIASRLIKEGIELVTLPDPLLGEVLADEGQMHQVLMNLVVNASDAMPNGGKLTIATRNVEIDASFAVRLPDAKSGPYVLLSVSDTGVGMDEETRSKIFEPFFTTKPKGVGTGLGLSTVYGIVRQEQGWIRVDSEVGKGSTFEIYLFRILTPNRVEPSELLIPRNRSGSETVLVVEDQPELRKLTADVLKTNGYRVIEASNGEEALDAASQYQGAIHLLLTDVVMPVMEGRELAERLKLLRPEIRVLYMSGYSENSIAHGGVIESGLAYIPKPFTLDALTATVRAALDAPLLPRDPPH